MVRESAGVPGDSGVLWGVLWPWSQSGSPDPEGVPSVRESPDPDPRGRVHLVRESPDPRGSLLAQESP